MYAERLAMKSVSGSLSIFRSGRLGVSEAAFHITDKFSARNQSGRGRTHHFEAHGESRAIKLSAAEGLGFCCEV
jgi:hypothetical protein